MDNNFKEKYKVPQNTITDKNIASLHDSANFELIKLLEQMDIFSREEVRDYLHNIVAAIILEHERYFEGFDIDILDRIKSERSKLNKTVDFFEKYGEFDYDKDNDKFSFHFAKDMLDIFAMKIIATNKRPTFNSTDPELKELIEEKKQNHKLLGKMEGFQFKLINNEFEKPPTYKYKVTKKDYYENCKILLEQIKTLISPEAIKLHEFYDEKLKSIKETTDILDNLGYLNNPISTKDFSDNSEINFLKILNDFSLRLHDKLDLAILTKQSLSVFKNSEILKRLGVELLPNIKQKRTDIGYVSNFLYIKTLVGVIECQLQSEHEYKAGNYGYAAHTKLEGKDVKPAKLPNIANPEEIEAFYEYTKFISPDSFSARLDNFEKNRVVIHEGSEYQNYKNIISQVPENSPIRPYLEAYFDELYALRNQIFKNTGSERGVMRADIEKYLSSDEFNTLKESIKSENEEQR